MKKADTLEAAPPAKKRRWRKPPSPVRIVPLSTSSNNGPLLGGGEVAANVRLNNLLQPELLSAGELISTLKDCHVPIDCNSSRQELITLFCKHVMPKPQRKRKRGGQPSSDDDVTKRYVSKDMTRNSRLIYIYYCETFEELMINS